MVGLAALLVLPPLGRFAVHRPATDVRRIPAALRLAVGTGLLLSAPSWRGFGVWAMLLAGVVGTVLLVPPLRHLLPPGTFVARPGLPMGMAARALCCFGFFGTEAFIPLGAGELRGASPAQAGLALTAGALGWVTASWIQDRLEAAGRQDTRVARARLGFVLLALGIVLVGAVLCSQLPLTILLLGWTIAGGGISLSFSTGGLLCIAAAPAEKQGEVAGQLQLSESLANSCGTVIGSTLLTWLKPLGKTTAHAWVFALTLSAALLGAALAGRLAEARAAADSPPGPGAG
jgi:predicted MFS family arabinose efflux permease